MPLVRMIVSCRATAATPSRDAFVNTLYFNVSGSVDPPNYQNLVGDLFTLWSANLWAKGSYLDIRAYDMGDAEPRPVKATVKAAVPGTRPSGPPQVALALSYFADRNLPGMRGRIFIGPWQAPQELATTTQQDSLITLGQGLAGIGGLNVDWSLYSPTRDDATRISNIWVDNSWDIIRGRKIRGTARAQASING